MLIRLIRSLAGKILAMGRKPKPAYVSHAYLGLDVVRHVHQYVVTYRVGRRTVQQQFEFHARTSDPKPRDTMARYFAEQAPAQA